MIDKSKFNTGKRLQIKKCDQTYGIDESNLIVHDLYGAEVYRGETMSNFGQIKAEINAKGFADGTYMLTIVAKDESTRTTHLMIKR